MLTDCGYQDVTFAFPFPDYKLPQVFYDEQSILEYEVDFAQQHNYDSDILECFNQVKALKSLKGTEEIKYFANSFLIEAIVKE